MTLQQFYYSTDSDNDIYRSGKIVVNGITFTIDAGTVAGSKEKPNEDTFSIKKVNDSIIAGVFDGVSSQKPIVSLGEQTGARFASHFLKAMFEEQKSTESLKEIIRDLNKKLLEKSLQFEGATLSDVHTLPVSTGTIVLLDPQEGKVSIGHVGDTFCMVQFLDNHTEFVTIDRNRKYDNERFALIKKIAKENHITPREARDDTRVLRAILDGFQASFNTPNGTGQGAINGDPHMEKYIQGRDFSLKSIKALLLGSDGIIPPGWDEQKEKDREKIFAILEKDGVKDLIRIKKQIEDSDPDWEFIRYKHSDDATGIFITFR
jgi:serine/threonine protein phosphatase PrpC